MKTGDTSGTKISTESTMEIRRWAFEKALVLKQDLDQLVDLIYKASEIEAYITDGENPRNDFYSCVDTALIEVAGASIPNVSESSKGKVIEVLRKWLKEYHALD